MLEQQTLQVQKDQGEAVGKQLKAKEKLIQRTQNELDEEERKLNTLFCVKYGIIIKGQ